MKDYWIGKQAKIAIDFDNKQLFYTAEILDISEKLITFRDRHGDVYSFNTSTVREISAT